MSDLEARIAVLETHRENHEKKFDEMAAKVNEMHALLMQARGARWAILGMAGIAGFAAGKISFLTGLLGMKLGG